MHTALTIARRELRGGLSRFWVVFACLALGTAIICGVDSLSRSVDDALARQSRALLGGDLYARQTYNPVPQPVREALEQVGETTSYITLRSMVRTATENARPDTDDTLLAEVKAVEPNWPLVGTVRLAPDQPLRSALESRGGVFGVAVEPALLDRLGLSLGDVIRLGEASFTVRATIVEEPDRAASAFTLGPRVLLSVEGLRASGLLRPGSLVRHITLAAAPLSPAPASVVADLEERFSQTSVTFRHHTRAAPGLRRLLDQLALFLTFVGLCALLIGGLGVHSGVTAYMDSKRHSIAVLKCVGASSRLVFSAYMLQVLALAGVGALVGVSLGALAPWAASLVPPDLLPFTIVPTVYPSAIGIAVVYALITALAFGARPLARARATSPADLFSRYASPTRDDGRDDTFTRLLTFGVTLLLAGAIVGLSDDRRLALWFCVGSVGIFLFYSAIAQLIQRIARRVGTAGLPPFVRLAIRAIHRPGNATVNVVFPLGLGLTVLVAVGQVNGALTGYIAERAPEDAPAFFFIDIDANQTEVFDRIVSAFPGVSDFRRMPMLRGRLARIDGQPVDPANVDPRVRWAVRGDRGVTYANTPPPGSRIVRGEWWPPDYTGPPLVSFVDNLAEGLGIAVGDTVTLNILGRDIDVRVANLRDVDWTTLQMNFSFVLSPGVLEGAPQTHIATVHMAPDLQDPDQAETALRRAVTDELPQVSAVRIRDVLTRVGRIVSAIAVATSSVAWVTLIAGLLVLAEALSAATRSSHYEAVVLKVLGATRAGLATQHVTNHLLLGLASGTTATLLGTLTAYLVVAHLMNLPFTPTWTTAIATGTAGILATLVLGLASLLRLANQQPADQLRNE